MSFCKEQFLILGASGLVGQEVFRLLRSQGHVAFGASRSQNGEGWRTFDLTDRSTHLPVLKEITTVMLISRPGDEQAAIYAKPFLTVMRKTSVRRIVDLSALGSAQCPEFSTRKVELLIEASGLGWTHVRPNFFMQTLTRPPLRQEIALHKKLSLPLGNARLAYIDALDVAAVLAKALVEETLTGRAVELNGPESLTHAEIVALISEGLEETVQYVDLPEDSARMLMLRSGMAPPQVERVLRFYALCRKGFGSQSDAEARVLLGRPLHTWTDFIARNRRMWMPSA